MIGFVDQWGIDSPLANRSHEGDPATFLRHPGAERIDRFAALYGLAQACAATLLS
jgi:hypothetical protein